MVCERLVRARPSRPRLGRRLFTQARSKDLTIGVPAGGR